MNIYLVTEEQPDGTKHIVGTAKSHSAAQRMLVRLCADGIQSVDLEAGKPIDLVSSNLTEVAVVKSKKNNSKK